MRLLALDPSSTCVGWASFQDDKLISCGAIRPRKRGTKYERLSHIANEAHRIVSTVREGYWDEAIIEEPYGGPNTQPLSIAFGVVYGLACIHAESIHTVAPTVWTKNVGKDMRATWVEDHFRDIYNRERDKGLDIADAIGIGHWWITEGRLRAESP